MFARAYSTIVFLFVAFPLIASATPSGVIESRQINQCNTGAIQCCQTFLQVLSIYCLVADFTHFVLFVQYDSPGANLLAGLLGIILGPIDNLIGLDCSPISVVGVGSGSVCNSNPACCTNNNIVRTGAIWFGSSLN